MPTIVTAACPERNGQGIEHLRWAEMMKLHVGALSMPTRFSLPPLGGAPHTPDGWRALSMRDVESRIWPWWLLAGAAAALALLLPHSSARPVPLGILAVAYVIAYAALRLSGLRCPYFCLLLIALNLAPFSALHQV